MEASSAVNTPHPDDAERDAAEDFFGGEAEGGDEAEERPTPLQTPPPGPTDAAAEGEAYRQEKEGTGAQDSTPEPASQAEGDEGSDEPAEGEPAGEASAQDAQDAKRRGSVEREYLVLQKVPLTDRALKHLLMQIEKGELKQPRVAYFELHRSQARNDRQAISEAYNKHREDLGERCDLAAVSARSFKERHVEPEEVPAERRVRIT